MTVMYAIHSKVRGRDNRTQRVGNPGRVGIVQYVGEDQQRLLRGRALPISEAALLRNLEGLKKHAAAGILEIRTQGGALVDLMTMTVGALPPPPPLPSFPLDSAKRDLPRGGEVMTPEGGDNLDEGGNSIGINEKPTLFDLAPREREEQNDADELIALEAAMAAHTGGEETTPQPLPNKKGKKSK